MMEQLVSATWLIDENGQPLRDRALVLRDEKIAAIGSASSLMSEYPNAEQVHVDGGVITPGLCDAHAHTELRTILAGVSSRDYFDFMIGVGDRRRVMSREELDASHRDACMRALAAGVTTILDWSSVRSRPLEIGSPSPHVMTAYEVMTAVRSISDVAALARAVEVEALAPHSLFMVHEDAWEAVVTEGRRRDLLLTIHVAEHASEREWIERGTGRLVAHLEHRRRRLPILPPTMRDALAATGLVAKDLSVVWVHALTLLPDELAVLGGKVCLCPRSNVALHGDVRPVSSLGPDVEILLGTDSFRGDVDLMQEAKVLLDREEPAQRIAVTRRLHRALTTPPRRTSPTARYLDVGSPADVLVRRVAQGIPQEQVLDAWIRDSEVAEVFVAGYQCRRASQRA